MRAHRPLYTWFLRGGLGFLFVLGQLPLRAGGPTIIQQPTPQSVFQGDTASFMVQAIGVNPTYQWKFNGGAINGATNDTLVLNNVQGTQAGEYKVDVRDPSGTTTSSKVNLTVYVPPTITSQPLDLTKNQGQSGSLSVAATGTSPLSYQWFFQNLPIPNATGQILSLSGLQGSQTGSYFAVASNLAGMATSRVATVTVIVPPSILQQPLAQTATLGSAVEFSVMAAGTAPFSYQWKFNGGKITDATNALLRIPNATPAVAGKYRVDISNPAGDVTSAEVNLTVDSTPPPPMDLVWTNLLGGIWGDAANWSPNRVPSFATDRAFIQAPGGYVVSLDAGVVLDRLTLGGGNETPTLIVSGPTLTLSGDSSIAPGAGLVLTAGTLNGAGSLTVGGTLNWQSGVIAKPVSVASEGQVTLSSSSTKVLQGASLINDGIVTWTDGGNFELTSGSALENNGTFAWLNNLEFKQGGGASSTLVNRGTLRKTVGSGTSKLKDIRLINSGTIEVQTGVLEISSGAAHVFGDGTTTRGAGTLYLNGVNVSAAGSFHHFGVLEFKSGTMVWTNSPSLNGTSTFLINGGKLYLDGEFPFQAPLELTSGTISSLVPGSVTLRGNLNWLGGNFEGNVVVGADGSLLLGGSQNKKLNDATLQNLGVMSYAGTGDLQATSASSLVNRGQFTFMNSGTLKQSGNGIAPLFDNSGSVGFGNAPTRINMEYAFNQSANGTLSLGLGGSTTNDIDQLLLSTNAVFNGTLNVTLRNGFSPAQGDQFDVIAYARRSGTFAQLTGESFKLVPDYRGSGLRLKAETLSFVSQPGNQTVTVLNPVTITGEVNGHGLLQWHFNNSPIPGATNPTLSIGSALPTHAGTYQLLASNHWGSTASRAVTLTVFSPLTQTSQPQSQTVVAGSNVSFSVGASSVAPIQYQWKFNGSAIAGATNATLTLASVTSAHAGKYKVEVGNGSQNFTSAEAILTVNVPVTITSPPASRAVITDDSTSFNVSVAGTPPFTYQWLFNGNPLPGANGDKLDLSHIVPAQAGAYAVMVSNVVGAVLSTSATLTVNVPAGIAVPPQNQSVTAGNSATFTVVPSGTPPFTYQWKFNNSTLPGATNASLVLNGVQTAQAGTYSVFVGNPFGPTVNAGAMLTVNVPVAIIQQPVSQDAVPGETATFFVAATGTPPISYQWRWNGTPIAGASQPMLTLTNVDTVIGGDYSVVVSNIAGAETSDTARLAVATNLRQAWVTRHNGTDNHHDGFRSAVMDPAGNVYVTGWSDEQDRDNDFVTIKYNAAGTRVWLAHYNGPDNSDDQAQAIGLDAAGNVVVTGFSKGVGSGFDYATVKYDPAGNQLWVARYNGPSNKDDLAHALALDATGNIHVTGASKGPGDTFHYGTVKYAPDGQQLWVARHVGTGNSEDQARAIAVDSAGNVIVTGKSKGVGSNFDYATVKYNAAGAQLWAARYNGPGNDVDEATAVAVDASGEVYVAGTSKGPGTDHDFATIKYDATGVMAWVTRYNGPVNKEDQATGMALDSQGRVLIIGASKGPGGNLDYLTQCLNPAGAQLWIARYNGPDDSDDLPSQVRVDAADEVYVTGGSKGPGTSLDFATIKYNQDGQKEWVARYNGTGNGDDIGRALVIDAENSVYVVGESKGSGTDLDAAIVKYTQPRPPAILVQPRSQSAPLLGPVFFNVLATGTGPLVYQWQLNGANIPGATNATLVIPSATVAANGNYQVTVSNPAGAVESEVAQLTITLPLVDFSDTFGAGLPNATLAGVGVGGNVGATVQPGEPNHGGKVGGHSVWFTWRAPASGVVTFSTAGSGFDTLLAAYQGNAVNGLTLVAGDDDSGGFLTSRISFNAQVGEVYHIAV
ncbi:MAG TPA: hypothetical protein DCY13_19140, partial [Verrucomicrobiales bacterium]|nr:hypothetical protein [Verrucomicrobiales bacterium]